MIIGERLCIAVRISRMQTQKSLTFRWRSFLGGSSDIVTSIFAYEGGQHYDHGGMPLHSSCIVQDAWPKIIDAPLTRIFVR